MDCSPLRVVCDRVAEELGKCQACGQKTFRVVTIRSAANLERRSALCGQHFVLAVGRFPELWSRQNGATRNLKQVSSIHVPLFLMSLRPTAPLRPTAVRS